MMEPYYQDEWTTLYLGDCRQFLPELEGLESIITDPVWPDADVKIPGCENPHQLFADMCQVIPRDTDRLVVQLGCDSDPRFLAGIPKHWPYLRTCWLDYARPSYKGRLLYTGDVGYIYGIPPAFIKGRQVMSGMCRSSRSDPDNLRHSHKPSSGGGRWTARNEIDELPHPCARRLQHVEWLVHQFSDNAVCDPFMGSGTTGVAAKKHGRHFTGIEIYEPFIEMAVNRIKKQQVVRQQILDLVTNPALSNSDGSGGGQ